MGRFNSRLLSSVRSQKLFHAMLHKQKHCVKKLRRQTDLFSRQINSNTFRSNRLRIELRLDVRLGYERTFVFFFWETFFGHRTLYRCQKKAEVKTIQDLYHNQLLKSTIAWCRGYPQALPLNALSSDP